MGPVFVGGGADVFAIARDIAVSVASGVTATVAILGLNRWSKELTGKAAFETARSLAKATYRLRDQIEGCRSPFVSSSEFPPGYAGRSPDSSVEADAWAFVYKARLAPVWAALQEFDASALEAEALWGASIRQSADKLRACLGKLRSAIQAIIDDKSAGGDDFKNAKDFGVSMRKIAFSSHGDEANDLTIEIKSAVTAIEAIVCPHLRRK